MVWLPSDLASVLFPVHFLPLLPGIHRVALLIFFRLLRLAVCTFLALLIFSLTLFSFNNAFAVRFGKEVFFPELDIWRHTPNNSGNLRPSRAWLQTSESPLLLFQSIQNLRWICLRSLHRPHFKPVLNPLQHIMCFIRCVKSVSQSFPISRHFAKDFWLWK